MQDSCVCVCVHMHVHKYAHIQKKPDLTVKFHEACASLRHSQ